MEEALLKALEGDPHLFVSLVLKSQVRVTKSVLKNILPKCTRKWGASFSEALSACLVHTLEALDSAHIEPAAAADAFRTPSPPKRKRRRQASENVVSQQKLQEEGPELGSRQQIMAHLRGCVLLVQLSMSHAKNAIDASQLFPVVCGLHDRLVTLEDDPELQEAITGLCELWWRDGLNGRDSLIAQSLPFLLSKSLTSNRKVDVHRVYAMREALCFFDFFDSSIEDLKHLLIRCVVTPSYLRSAEGRRFISFIFGMNAQLVKELNALMRSQIPFGRKSILEAYGEILYRAWKTATGPSLTEIELTCIQALMESAIHASTKILNSAARKVLEGFMSQRAETGVEAMLFRLQEPLLFRALQVANSNVRRNALHLLIDMFPVQDPDASNEEKEALFEKQFVIIEKLLLDPCPEVRSVAIEGVCKILGLFWEIVPSATTVNLLTMLVDQMAKDQASVCGRVAVLDGIRYLLENPQSHELLKEVVPRLAPMLNDPAVAVRSAAADLLLSIKNIRSISIFKVARLDSVLASLGTDNVAVAQRLTRLLMSSYFPSTSSAEACTRCFTLIKRSPAAGARFCSLLLAEGASPASLLELVKFLSTSALPDAELDSEHQEGVFLALSELCGSLASSAQWRRAMADHLSGKLLISLLKGASTSSARTSIMRLASTLPPQDVPELVKYCGQTITEFARCQDDYKSDEIRAVYSFVLSWGGFDDLIEALMNMLSRKSVPKSRKTSARKQNKTGWSGKLGMSTVKKRSLSTDASSLTDAVGAAWHVQNLLAEPDTRNALITSKAVQDLILNLRQLVEDIMKSLRKGCSSHDFSSSIIAYVNLHIHLALQQVRDPTTSSSRKRKHSRVVASPIAVQGEIEKVVEELVTWTNELLQEIFVPTVAQSKAKRRCSSRSGREDSTDNSLDRKSLDIVATTFRLISEALNLGLISALSVKSNILEFASSFIRSLQRAVEKGKLQWLEKASSMKAVLSYIGKILFICLQDSDSISPIICKLGTILLDTLAVLEQLAPEYSAWILPALRSWMSEVVTAAASASSSIEGVDSIWPSYIATTSYHSMNTQEQKEDDRTSAEAGTELLRTVVATVRKEGLQGFVDIIAQHAVAWLMCEEIEKGIGCLNIITECQAPQQQQMQQRTKKKIELNEEFVVGLRSVIPKLESDAECSNMDAEKLLLAQKLVRLIVDGH